MARRKRSSRFRYFCVAALLVALCFGLGSFRLPFWVAGLYFGVGLISFAFYGLDKSAAVAGRRRVRDAHLLTLDTLFGILGGLLAQQVFRHKTMNPLFICAALGLTALHLLIIISVIESLPGPVRTQVSGEMIIPAGAENVEQDYAG